VLLDESRYTLPEAQQALPSARQICPVVHAVVTLQQMSELVELEVQKYPWLQLPAPEPLHGSPWLWEARAVWVRPRSATTRASLRVVMRRRAWCNQRATRKAAYEAGIS
jgi:hypothetical protein